MTDPKPITAAQPYSVDEVEKRIASLRVDLTDQQRFSPEARYHFEQMVLFVYPRILATAQQAERRWVPVSERVPEHGLRCWFVNAHGRIWDGYWQVDTAAFGHAQATHWQPFVVPDQPEV